MTPEASKPIRIKSDVVASLRKLQAKLKLEHLREGDFVNALLKRQIHTLSDTPYRVERAEAFLLVDSEGAYFYHQRDQLHPNFRLQGGINGSIPFQQIKKKELLLDRGATIDDLRLHWLMYSFALYNDDWTLESEPLESAKNKDPTGTTFKFHLFNVGAEPGHELTRESACILAEYASFLNPDLPTGRSTDRADFLFTVPSVRYRCVVLLDHQLFRASRRSARTNIELTWRSRDFVRYKREPTFPREPTVIRDHVNSPSELPDDVVAAGHFAAKRFEHLGYGLPWPEAGASYLILEHELPRPEMFPSVRWSRPTRPTDLRRRPQEDEPFDRIEYRVKPPDAIRLN